MPEPGEVVPLLRTVPSPARSPAGATYIFGGLIVGWLFFSAAIVDIEYYDGLSAICNARYFLGDSDFYIFDRGPLMAWLQMPAEAVKQWLALHPLDVRPHHTAMAVIHIAYLLAVSAALVRVFGRQWAVLVAFAAAITNYVFASYAPFLSHDLAPGALLLWMLLWSDDFVALYRADNGAVPGARPRLWMLLAFTGAVAPLVKQTYGVFWIAVLGAHVITTFARDDPKAPPISATLVPLVGAAAVSAVLAWSVYGIVLENWAPNVPLLLRPYRNLQYLGSVYDGTDVRFPWWIYVRNVWAYGWLTAALLIPGLVLSLRGSLIQRRVAVAWLIAIVFIHLMPLREVRYLAFLAPLSAFLIVPALRLFAARRVVMWGMGLMLIADVSGAVNEAARVGTGFYRHSELEALVEPLPDQPTAQQPMFFNVSMLSFVSPDQSPLAADRYHGVFHVGAHHLRVLYGYSPSSVRVVPLGPASPLTASAPEGTLLLFANEILAYGPTWDLRPPPRSETFVQGLATLQTTALRRAASDVYYIDGSSAQPDDGVQYMFPVAVIDGEPPAALDRQPDGGFIFTTATQGVRGERVTMRAFVVQRRSPRRPSSATARARPRTASSRDRIPPIPQLFQRPPSHSDIR